MKVFDTCGQTAGWLAKHWWLHRLTIFIRVKKTNSILLSSLRNLTKQCPRKHKCQGLVKSRMASITISLECQNFAAATDSIMCHLLSSIIQAILLLLLLLAANSNWPYHSHARSIGNSFFAPFIFGSPQQLTYSFACSHLGHFSGAYSKIPLLLIYDYTERCMLSLPNATSMRGFF